MIGAIPNPGIIAGPRGQAILIRTFSNSLTVGSGNAAFTLPSGSAGELMVAQIGYRDSPQFAMPSGWTVIYQDSNASTAPSGPVGVCVAYKVRGASEADPTFTRTAGGSATGFVTCYDPSIGGLTFGSFSQNNNGTGSSTTHSTGSVTAAGTNSLVVVTMVKSFFWTTPAPNLSAASLAAAATTGTLVGAADPVLDTPWQNMFFAARSIGNVVGTQGFDLVGVPAGATGTISVGSMANTSYYAVAANFGWL